MKSFKNLNARGFSHHFVMAFIVLAAAIGGTYYLVASHAQVPYSNPYSCSSQTLLKSGSQGTCVRYLQYSLGIAADGDFGPATKLAVQNFQYANHVAGSSCTTSASTCDGIVGSYTWAKVNAVNSAKTLASAPKPVVAAPKPVVVAPVADPAPTAPKPVAAVPVTAPAPDPVKATVPVAAPAAPKPVVGAICDGTKPTLRQGSTGNCVRYLQKALDLSQDGDFGPATNAKVVSFQSSHKLTADGVVGACTWTALAGGATSAACTRTTSVATPAAPATPATRSTPATPATPAKTPSSYTKTKVYNDNPVKSAPIKHAPKAKVQSKSFWQKVWDGYQHISGSS